MSNVLLNLSLLLAHLFLSAGYPASARFMLNGKVGVFFSKVHDPFVSHGALENSKSPK